MSMNGVTVLDSVKKCLHACFGACKLGINGIFIETFPLVVGSRAEGGVTSKLGD